MAKQSKPAKDAPAETRAERQTRLLDRDYIDIPRREERRVVGLERQLEALTADWE